MFSIKYALKVILELIVPSRSEIVKTLVYYTKKKL